MKSCNSSGTSVYAAAVLTYFSSHSQFCLATSSKQRILSSARYMLALNIPPLLDLLRSSPFKYFWSGAPRSAWYRYALNAPGSTVTNPNTDSMGLSKMLLILYSKFCAATSGLRSSRLFFPRLALISPHAPATRGSLKAFHNL
ncbi:hypothetical protein OGATHE_002230 [Ogataea polymorpha]|uniref:Uncharacterized protein n=1 Tax=Ogataea polymorpha TaxID=460523 RepID=A0A9P8PJ53_9ASCO|nr:hypothetical protein OGATHE_002230 [Ogataea polymorpha]